MKFITKKRNVLLAALCLTAVTCSMPALAENATAAQQTVASTVKNGLVVENGVNHIYKNNKLVKSQKGYKLGTKYYQIDKKGKAKEVSEAMGRAGILMQKKKITTLKKAFNWCYKNIKYSGVKTQTKNKADNYAIIGFKSGKGECNVMAACFYQMAKVLGYKDVKFVQGKIKAANGKANHTWVTIKQGKKTYVYDPNFAFVFHKRQNVSAAHSGYKMTYTKAKNATKKQYTYYTKKGKLLK